LDFSFFVAKKVAGNRQGSFARLIIRLATAAVALSMAVMILASALIKGFKYEISEKMFGFWGHIHITSAEQTTSFDPKPMRLDSAMLGRLSRIKNQPLSEGGKQKGSIVHVQQYATKAGIIKTKENFEGIVLKGIGNDYDWRFLERNLVEGKRFAPRDSALNEILISKTTAERLQLRPGSKLVVHFVNQDVQVQKRFTVAGVFKTGLEEYDRKFAVCDISIIQELSGWDTNQVAGLELFAEDIRQIDGLNEYIYQNALTSAFYTQTIREEQPSIFDWLDLQDVNEKVILGLMLAVSIINMVTALLILILERSVMIGTLKALGATDWRIQKIFLYYGAIIVALGLLMGNVLGLGLAWLQKKYNFIRLSEADYYLAYAPIKLDFMAVLTLNLGAFIIIFICLRLPSLIVSRISPVKVIRFK
jgi:lipoprotein-releasing system permease protein